MTTKTYNGSCHCQRVKYQADLDLAGETTRCNCTWCAKTRAWGLNTKPAAFRLLEGEEVLGSYSKSGFIQHRFCTRCGVQVFATGDIPQIGGAFVGVVLSTLDDAEPAALAATPIRYCNGRDNLWQDPPRETRYL